MSDDENQPLFNPRPHGRHTALPRGERQARASCLALSLIEEQEDWQPDPWITDQRWVMDGFLTYDEAVGPKPKPVTRSDREDPTIEAIDDADVMAGMARRLTKAKQKALDLAAEREERAAAKHRAQMQARIAAIIAEREARKPKPNPQDPFGRAARRRQRRVDRPVEGVVGVTVAEGHEHVWRPGAGYVQDGKSYVHTEVCRDCPAIREVEPYIEGVLLQMPEKVITVETPAGLHRELPVTVLPKEQQPDAIFEPPPPPPAPPPPPKGKWERLIDAARTRPGEWARTPWSMKEQSAKAQASGVRHGRVPGVKQMPGTELWEAQAGLLDGHWYVWVRFMGEARIVAEDGTA